MMEGMDSSPAPEAPLPLPPALPEAGVDALPAATPASPTSPAAALPRLAMPLATTVATTAQFLPRRIPGVRWLVFAETAVTATVAAREQYLQDRPRTLHASQRVLRAAVSGGLHAGGAVSGTLIGGSLGATVGSAILPFGGTLVGGLAGAWLLGTRGERLGRRAATWYLDRFVPGVPRVPTPHVPRVTLSRPATPRVRLPRFRRRSATPPDAPADPPAAPPEG